MPTKSVKRDKGQRPELETWNVRSWFQWANHFTTMSPLNKEIKQIEHIIKCNRLYTLASFWNSITFRYLFRDLSSFPWPKFDKSFRNFKNDLDFFFISFLFAKTALFILYNQRHFHNFPWPTLKFHDFQNIYKLCVTLIRRKRTH